MSEAKSRDDLSLNNILPSKGDMLEIPGVDFFVEVTRLKASDTLVDGVGDPVTTIYFKGKTASQTALLARAYISSLELYTIQSDDEEDEEEEEGEEEEFIPIQDGSLVGIFVRRYFDNFGWFNGTVIAQAANVNGEMQYTITYPEDNDREDLNQDLFDEARAYYYQSSQPVLPIELVRFQDGLFIIIYIYIDMCDIVIDDRISELHHRHARCPIPHGLL